MGEDAFWQYCWRWERDHSNNWDLLDKDGAAVSQQFDQADALFERDHERAVAIYHSLAEGGSAWAMRQVARFHLRGSIGEVDEKQAEAWYRRALLAGSNYAYVDLAELYRRQERGKEWKSLLEQGAATGFAPASYRLAWFQYQQNPTRLTARHVRPLLEEAAQAGHPGARWLLYGWQMRGTFGFGEIRQGLRDFWAMRQDFHRDRKAREGEQITKAAA